MWVSIDFCLIPLGVGVNLSPYIAACQKIIVKSGLLHELGPNGTAIEGEWSSVFKCIEDCHTEIHNLGSPRIYTTLKINTRKDRKQSFKEKVPSVVKALS
tara:strand:+ start:1913 stop:2212 length:300 start_codon:yes stop_codon:yes gene_type:complete